VGGGDRRRAFRTEEEVLFEIGRFPAAERQRAPRPPRPPRIEVLREEPGWVAILKPAGLASVRERWNREAPTALSLLHREWLRKDPDAPLPFVIHRLDKETSGLLLFGRDQATARALSEAFRHRRVAKEYFALVDGAPPEPAGEIELLLVPDPRRPEAMRVDPKRGKRSATSWETLEAFRGHTLLRVTPRTGRTHQIRVTLAHLGCPVVADPLYGSGQPLLLSRLKRGYAPPRDHPEFPLLGRLGLHARALRFEDPAGGGEVVVEAEPPKDLRVALERLRRHAPGP
jgi:23S rRNA pseudouridine1911/1915/1917 synthase